MDWPVLMVSCELQDLISDTRKQQTKSLVELSFDLLMLRNFRLTHLLMNTTKYLPKLTQHGIATSVAFIRLEEKGNYGSPFTGKFNVLDYLDL